MDALPKYPSFSLVMDEMQCPMHRCQTAHSCSVCVREQWHDTFGSSSEWHQFESQPQADHLIDDHDDFHAQVEPPVAIEFGDNGGYISTAEQIIEALVRPPPSGRHAVHIPPNLFLDVVRGLKKHLQAKSRKLVKATKSLPSSWPRRRTLRRTKSFP